RSRCMNRVRSIQSTSFMLCFFFYSSGIPQALPSFPTRRSSDLIETVLDTDTATAGEIQAWLQRQDGIGGHRGRVDAGARPVFPQDRKSTRLNSSHLVISYAVFCFKKKNNTVAPMLDRSHPHLER